MENLERVKQFARDLRKEDPRPAHEELGGESHAARALDKCRATLLGWEGEYKFGCPMDQHLFQETGIDMEEFRSLVATGADDQEMAEWIRSKTQAERSAR